MLGATPLVETFYRIERKTKEKKVICLAEPQTTTWLVDDIFTRVWSKISAHCRTKKMKMLICHEKKWMSWWDNNNVVVVNPLEFPRSQWLLLLEWSPFRCGDFVEIRRSRHTIDDSRHWRRILSGNGQIGLCAQSSTRTIGLRHRSCWYVNIFL